MSSSAEAIFLGGAGKQATYPLHEPDALWCDRLVESSDDALVHLLRVRAETRGGVAESKLYTVGDRVGESVRSARVRVGRLSMLCRGLMGKST